MVILQVGNHSADFSGQYRYFNQDDNVRTPNDFETDQKHIELDS